MGIPPMENSSMPVMGSKPMQEGHSVGYLRTAIHNIQYTITLIRALSAGSLTHFKSRQDLRIKLFNTGVSKFCKIPHMGTFSIAASISVVDYGENA